MYAFVSIHGKYGMCVIYESYTTIKNNNNNNNKKVDKQFNKYYLFALCHTSIQLYILKVDEQMDVYIVCFINNMCVYVIFVYSKVSECIYADMTRT